MSERSKTGNKRKPEILNAKVDIGNPRFEGEGAIFKCFLDLVGMDKQTLWVLISLLVWKLSECAVWVRISLEKILPNSKRLD